MDPAQIEAFKDAVGLLTSVDGQAGNISKRFSMGMKELKSVIDKMSKEHKRDKSLVEAPPAYTAFLKASDKLVDASRDAQSAVKALEKMIADKKTLALPLNKVWSKVLEHSRHLQALLELSAPLVRIYESELPIKKTLPPEVNSVKVGFTYLEAYKKYLNEYMKALAKVK